ncbi:hypothetical protein [Paracoccus sp. (in: a-proteobacteria)]|uniref:hypothetical protein n=1 Tax=Paracoccus sp. TaxID=267 RepID=UPI0028B2440A|nr:hypothetical protein [Paracoccus sp. (in: a-proteobacteria)]
MIRQPSDLDAVYSWWRRSVSGERVPRIEDEPHPGYYKRRMVRGGPFVPVAIWLDQPIDPETGELTAPEELRAIVNGRPADPLHVWLYARPISESEYDALTGVRDRFEEMAATHVAVDLGAMAPIRP